MNTPKTQPKRERTDKERKEPRQAIPVMKNLAVRPGRLPICLLQG
jgi:hypothetical protein